MTGYRRSSSPHTDIFSPDSALPHCVAGARPLRHTFSPLSDTVTSGSALSHWDISSSHSDMLSRGSAQPHFMTGAWPLWGTLHYLTLAQLIYMGHCDLGGVKKRVDYMDWYGE